MANRNPHFNVRRSFFWAILLPFLLVVSVLTIMWLQSRAYVASTSRLLKTERIIADFYELKKYIVDTETSVRGYILYDYRAEYLEPYIIAIGHIQRLSDEIFELLEPAQKLQFESLREEIKIWMRDMASMVAQKDHGALAESFKRPGRLEKMRSIRSEIAEFIELKEELREKRVREHDAESKLTIYVSFILGILLSGLISMIVWRGIVSTSVAYEEVLNDLDALNEKLKIQNDKLEETVDIRTAELRSTNAELEAFSYSVSHDLRAPLRGIDGFSQALLEDYPDKIDAQGKQYLYFIREGVQKMGKLIDDLLNLSRISRLDASRAKVDLTEIIKEVFTELKSDKPDEKRNLIVPNEKNMVYGDPGLLKLALENLVANAWKFTSKSKNPTIEFGTTKIDGQKVYFIRDNGAGFDMRFKDKLFGAFQRLHSAIDFAGTGVGLATVKRIILKHGGEIWAEGKVNEGATFYFRLS